MVEGEVKREVESQTLGATTLRDLFALDRRLGRKTEVKDCMWIAQLLEHGLLQGSFVPPAPIRDKRPELRISLLMRIPAIMIARSDRS